MDDWVFNMNKQPSTWISKGKQSNHGCFLIPQEIRHLRNLPLYRAVAWWGLIRGSEFTRTEVSQAFQIDLRRASDILHYICHRYEGNDITFQHRKIPARGGHHLLVLRILSVEPAPVTAAGQGKPGA